MKALYNFPSGFQVKIRGIFSFVSKKGVLMEGALIVFPFKRLFNKGKIGETVRAVNGNTNKGEGDK